MPIQVTHNYSKCGKKATYSLFAKGTSKSKGESKLKSAKHIEVGAAENVPNDFALWTVPVTGEHREGICI